MALELRHVNRISCGLGFNKQANARRDNGIRNARATAGDLIGEIDELQFRRAEDRANDSLRVS
jgi:hypothetical protein